MPRKSPLVKYNGSEYTYEQLGRIARRPCCAASMRRRIKEMGCVKKAVEDPPYRGGKQWLKFKYYDQYLNYEQLGRIARVPCTAASMRKRIKRLGCVYKAVEGKSRRGTRPSCKFKYYDKELTCKELASLSSPPCTAEAMRKRIKKFGCVYKAVEAKSQKGRICKVKYYDKELTYKELASLADFPCTADTMRSRIKRLGCVYKAVSGEYSRIKRIEYEGKRLTYEELGRMAVHPCTAGAMQQRIRKLGCVSAALKFAKTRKKACLFDKFDNPALARWIKKHLLGLKKRINITLDDLYCIGESQNWRCALSGIKMTFGKGGEATNISVDRIQAGGEYSPENIRLVCSAINKFRSNLKTEDFIYFCKCVANHNKKELKIAS